MNVATQRVLYAVIFTVAVFLAALFAGTAFADAKAEEVCEATVGPKSSSYGLVISSAKAVNIDVLEITGEDLVLFDEAYKAKYGRNESGAPEGLVKIVMADPRKTDKPYVPSVFFNKDDCSIGTIPFEVGAVIELLDAVDAAKKGL